LNLQLKINQPKIIIQVKIQDFFFDALNKPVLPGVAPIYSHDGKYTDGIQEDKTSEGINYFSL